MQFFLLAVLSLTACASAFVDVESVFGYHEKVAIPLAAKIKAAEEAILAKQNSNSRIVGGNVIAPHSLGFVGGVLINYKKAPGLGVCSCTLVTPITALTAAHCWFDGVTQASIFTVVLGSQFLFSGGDRFQSYRVTTHPEWNPLTLQNNLAVIGLPKRAVLTRNAQPIPRFTDPNESLDGLQAVAAGFGVTVNGSSTVPVLSQIHAVELQVITLQECQRSFGNIVQPNTICTNGTGGVGTCQGDAGGPLFITRGEERVLIGISTFGASAGCTAGFPSGYSRITSFNQFIDSHI